LPLLAQRTDKEPDACQSLFAYDWPGKYLSAAQCESNCLMTAVIGTLLIEETKDRKIDTPVEIADAPTLPSRGDRGEGINIAASPSTFRERVNTTASQSTFPLTVTGGGPGRGIREQQSPMRQARKCSSRCTMTGRFPRARAIPFVPCNSRETRRGW